MTGKLRRLGPPKDGEITLPPASSIDKKTGVIAVLGPYADAPVTMIAGDVQITIQPGEAASFIVEGGHWKRIPETAK